MKRFLLGLPLLGLVVAGALAFGSCDAPAPAQSEPAERSDAGAPPPEAASEERGQSRLQEWWARLEYAVRARTTPPPTSIAVPVRGVAKEAIADTYGAPRGGGRLHEGVDIFAPEGTPVLAAADGMVTQVGTNRLGGLVVTVWGAGDRRYYYAHLSRHGDVVAGDLVKAGDVLGYVGRTGNARSTPPHLHFGVYEAGWEALNPYPLLE